MSGRYPRALALDPLRWIDLGRELRDRDARDHADRQKRTARALLRRFYGAPSVPGVILGDEVGMGKTYEALAVIAALFAHVPNPRVLVLTHSHGMAKTWSDRWATFRGVAVGRRHRSSMPEGELLGGTGDVARGHLGFASYDRLKQTPAHELRSALERCFEGRWLRAPERRRLARRLLGTGAPARDGEIAARIMPSALDRFWRRHFDREERDWKRPSSALRDLRRLVFRASRTRRQLDLLIVDEAHKVASRQRSLFLEEVFGRRTARALYVTATPFSLRIEQLADRIEDMHDVTGDSKDGLRELRRDLEAFRDAVHARSVLAVDLKHRVERTLGRYLIRSTWPDDLDAQVKRRKARSLPVLARVENEQQARAMLALEAALLRVSDEGERTHITAHRETLCSSYGAIRAACERAEGADRPFARWLRRLEPILPRENELPKFEALVDHLESLMRHREKVVVFCSRVATVQALARRLRARVRSEVHEERLRWRRVQKRLHARERAGAEKFAASDLPLLRLAVHAAHREVAPRHESAAVRGLRLRLARSGEPGEANRREELWQRAWGPRRRVEWVGVLAGSDEEGDAGRSRDVTQFAFNLPGPPYVLLCTKIAREGIDLHRWCRRIVLYDLEWNPALLEQQIGRVDRIGSLSRRVRQPLELIWTVTPGTYEEYMKAAVEKRLDLMKVLLGAGEWLARSPETQELPDDLEPYRLDFSP